MVLSRFYSVLVLPLKSRCVCKQVFRLHSKCKLVVRIVFTDKQYTKISGALAASAAVSDIAKQDRGWVAGALKVQLLVHRLRLPQNDLFCSALRRGIKKEKLSYVTLYSKNKLEKNTVTET